MTYDERLETIMIGLRKVIIEAFKVMTNKEVTQFQDFSCLPIEVDYEDTDAEFSGNRKARSSTIIPDRRQRLTKCSLAAAKCYN